LFSHTFIGQGEKEEEKNNAHIAMGEFSIIGNCQVMIE
jgi:hypothetical protein